MGGSTYVLDFKLPSYKHKSDQSSLNKSRSYCRILKKCHGLLSQRVFRIPQYLRILRCTLNVCFHYLDISPRHIVIFVFEDFIKKIDCLFELNCTMVEIISK